MNDIRTYFLLLIGLLLSSIATVSAKDTISHIYTNPFHDSLTTNLDSPRLNAVDTLLTIRRINVVGNKITKRKVILREIPFQEGSQYAIAELVNSFQEGKRLLLNTQLFVDVIIAAEKFEGSFVDIIIDVRERWYIFPVPYIHPVDRNLNQWLFEKGGRLNRLDYGVKLMDFNTTGFGDKLRLFLITGYTKQLTLGYEIPYIDKKLKWGINAELSLGKNKEVNYNTIEDKQFFVKQDDKYLRNYFAGKFELTYRNAIFTKHRFGIAYTQEKINDTVHVLNPNYFSNNQKSIKIPELYYRLDYTNLDYIPYPTKGHAARLEFRKKGFDKNVNSWELFAIASGSWHTGKKSFFNLTAHAGAKFPSKQPYYLQRALGYNDVNMQGYEYYVVDGTLGGFVKATLSRQLFSFSVKTPGKNRQIPERLPFTFYGKIYGNAGYIYNEDPHPSNILPNKMLYSGGIGLDIFTSYDFCIKIEFSLNGQGENGLFLHRKSTF